MHGGIEECQYVATYAMYVCHVRMHAHVHACTMEALEKAPWWKASHGWCWTIKGVLTSVRLRVKPVDLASSHTHLCVRAGMHAIACASVHVCIRVIDAAMARVTQGASPPPILYCPQP